MDNERQETIADIVSEIRAQNLGLPEDSYALSPLVCDLLSLARRIEVANAREREVGAEAAQIYCEIGEMIVREATSENSSQVGNAAKIRDALMALIGVIDKYDSGNPLWWNSGAKGVMPLKDARSVLSALPRN